MKDFDELLGLKEKGHIGNSLESFLAAASHFNLSKNDLSICSYIAKENSKLIVTSIKEFLFMDYEGNEESGVYEYKLSKAFNKLEGFNTNNQSLEKFPRINIDMDEKHNWISIGRVQANLMLEAFKFVSKDETRYFMQGIHFDEGNIVSTDGRRLFFSLGFDKFPAVILPSTKCLEWLLKKGVNIKYRVDKTFSVFQFEYKDSTFFYYTSVVDGQFPNWKKVVPEKQEYVVSIPSLSDWKEIYSKIKSLSNKRTSERIIITHISDNKVSIEWENKNMGLMDWEGFFEEARMLKYSQLAINYSYFNEALTLKAVKEIQFSEFRKAITFIYGDGSIQIVMPINVIRRINNAICTC